MNEKLLIATAVGALILAHQYKRLANKRKNAHLVGEPCDPLGAPPEGFACVPKNDGFVYQRSE